mgnify:CR=1 FL=1
MVQEVQEWYDIYKDPNEIRWIWYTDRKLSFKTQIRDKEWVGMDGDAVISLRTDTAVDPWNTWTFDNMSITSWGKWWTWVAAPELDGAVAPIPPAWTYVLTWHIDSYSGTRHIETLEIRVNSSRIWSWWSGDRHYYGTMAYTFDGSSFVYCNYIYSWWSSNKATRGTLTFVKLR